MALDHTSEPIINPPDVHEDDPDVSNIKHKIRATRIQIVNPGGESNNQTIIFTTERRPIVIDEAQLPSIETIKWLGPEGGIPGQQVRRYMADVETVTETITLNDPVTGQTVTISVGGIAIAIEAMFREWYLDDQQAANQS